MINTKKRYLLFIVIWTLIFVMMPVTKSQLFAATTESWKTAVNYDAQTLTINKPENTGKGKVLIAQITFEKGLDALPINYPAGWIHIISTYADQSGGNKDIGQSLYYKIADTSEPSSYTWTFGQKVKALGGIICYSGVDVSDPIITSGGRGGEGDSTGQNQLVAPGISATGSAKLIAFYGFKENADLDVPAGMSGIYEARDEQNDYTILSSDENVGKSGATGDRISKSWEFDDSGKPIESEWVAQQILLRDSGSQGVITPVSPTQEIKVVIDGKTLTLFEKPFIENGRTLIPMRALFEALGAEVFWDQTNRVAMGIRNQITIRIPIGSTSPTVNGTPISIDVPAKISNNRTYVPLRFVGEALEHTVEWDNDTRTVFINTK